MSACKGKYSPSFCTQSEAASKLNHCASTAIPCVVLLRTNHSSPNCRAAKPCSGRGIASTSGNTRFTSKPHALR
ncbi:Uncharacterised protein [Vibrio cholerae]|nr:Uncharacterised protein [Vibrio cholerae]